MNPDLLYQERSPPPELAVLLECVWQLSGPKASGAGPHVQPIVPDGCPEIVLNLTDPFIRWAGGERWIRQPRSLLVGQLTGPALVGPSGVTRVVGLRLTP